MELPVVNHKDYVAKLGDDHKFPINKFGELAKYLIDQKIVKKFHNPEACSFETLNRAHSKNYINDIKNEYVTVRKRLEDKKLNPLLPIQKANENKLALDWDHHKPIKPNFLGTKTFNNIPISVLRDYIDWTPFFRSWDLLKGLTNIILGLNRDSKPSFVELITLA